MKKIAVIFTAIMSLTLNGCSKKPAETNMTGNIPVKLEEYYENIKIDNTDYLCIEDLKVNNNLLYFSGKKSETNGLKCSIISPNENTAELVSMDFEDLYPDDVCRVGDALYLIDSYGIYLVDIVSGEITERRVRNLRGDIEHDDEFLYAISEDGYIMKFDLDLNFIEKTELAEITGNTSEQISINKVLKTKDGFYFWGDNCNKSSVYESLFLYATDNKFNKRFSKEYSDMAGYAYSLYEVNNSILLTSFDINDNGDGKSYVNIVSSEDGEVLDWYEIENSQFVLPALKENEVIIQDNYQTSIYNTDTNEKNVMNELNCCDLYSGKLFFSDNCYFSFSDYDSGVLTSFSAIENDCLVSEKKLDMNYNKSGISGNGNLYIITFDDNRNNQVVLYSEEDLKQDKIITLSVQNPAETLYPSTLEYIGNKIYIASSDESTHSEYISVFSDDGRELYKIASEYPVYNIVGNEDNIFVLSTDNSGYNTVCKINDESSEKINLLDDMYVDKIYAGDDEYSLYFYSDYKIYGYNHELKEKKRILNCIDSSISEIPDFFLKYDKDTYICCCGDKIFKLLKADENLLKQMNNRKIITMYGTEYSLTENMLKKIFDFNAESREYFITYIDYTNDYESNEPIKKELINDIISGEIPDIFLLDGINNYDSLKSLGAFKDLKQYINSDFKLDEQYSKMLSAYNNKGQYGIASEFSYSGILCNECSNLFNSNYTYENFLETVLSKNIKFKNTTIYDLYWYFVIDHSDDFINYSEKKCSFDSDLFISLLEYIKTGVSNSGQLSLCTFSSAEDFEEMFRNESDYELFDVSFDGGRRGVLKFRNAVAFSSVSDVMEGSVDFYKKFLEPEYQLSCTEGFPVNLNYISPENFELSEDQCNNIVMIFEKSQSVKTPDQNILNILNNGMYELINEGNRAEDVAKEISNQINLLLKESY